MRYRYSRNSDGSISRSAQIWTKEEHKINNASVDPLAIYICEKLNKEGHETYIVGGAVRDLLLNKIPKDFDIASSATPARIKRIFNNSRVIGKRFRLVHVFFGNKIFEIATFRSIKADDSGNIFGTIEEDVQRRDFTMNALFYDPRKELVIDFVGGFADIRAKKIKPIIPLNRIFEEDPIRMVRAVKYAVISGFKMQFFLRHKIKKSAHGLKKISPSRLTEEISKILKSPRAGMIIPQLQTLGLYLYLQPRASKLISGSPDFARRYYRSFGKLTEENTKDGEEYAEAIAAGLKTLVRDYLDDNTDWSTASEDTYKTSFKLARKFVLPVNPPRIELSRAMRDLYAEHGIKINRWRCMDRNK
ncbi:MAG: polynucleotide adenylyltransferase PcnB [Spirochaetaceae bacterium]|jgi:poly(A) polymerase|nr:polynucleotide adenylyltransferase PcnB [Spirochaetaceae bacterium]